MVDVQQQADSPNLQQAQVLHHRRLAPIHLRKFHTPQRFRMGSQQVKQRASYPEVSS